MATIRRRKGSTEGRLTVRALADEMTAGFKAGDDRMSAIEGQLHHITHEVTANGAKGLDASLKDIYREVKTTQAEVRELIKVTQGDVDRHRAVEAVKVALRTSWIGKLTGTRVVRFLLVLVFLAVVDGVLHQFDLHILELAKLIGGMF